MISEEHQISELRRGIDQLDEIIIKNLNERAKIVLSIRELKKQADLPIFDPQREQEIITKLSLINEGPLNNDCLLDLYSKILVCMKNFE